MNYDTWKTMSPFEDEDEPTAEELRDMEDEANDFKFDQMRDDAMDKEVEIARSRET